MAQRDTNSFWRAGMLATFVLHNAEEAAFLDHGLSPDPRVLGRLGLTEDDYRADRLSLASALLTAVVTVATSPRFRRDRSPLASAVATATAGGLMVNALGHLLQAVVRRRYNPGVLTAPALMVTAARNVAEVRAGSNLSRARATIACAAGAVVSVPAIVIALRAARLITRF